MAGIAIAATIGECVVAGLVKAAINYTGLGDSGDPSTKAIAKSIVRKRKISANLWLSCRPSWKFQDLTAPFLCQTADKMPCDALPPNNQESVSTKVDQIVQEVSDLKGKGVLWCFQHNSYCVHHEKWILLTSRPSVFNVATHSRS